MNEVFVNIKYQIYSTFSRTIFKFILFIQPILHSFILYMIYKNSSNEVFLDYAFIGTGMMSFWTVVLFSSASDLERERLEGTLANLFITPQNFFKLILSKAIGNILLGFIPILISIIVLFYFRPIYININIFKMSIIILLGITTFVLFSTLFSFAFTISRNTRLLINNLEYPLYILSGIVFPITELPYPLQILSKFFPLYWVNKAVREVINNKSIEKSVLVLIFFIVIYLIISKKMFKVFIKKIKIKGSIEVM
mgnify:FL=1